MFRFDLGMRVHAISTAVRLRAARVWTHRRAFAVGASVLLVLSTFAAVYLSQPTRSSVESQGGSNPVPGWEPWFFFVDDKVNAGSGNLFLNFTDITVRARGWTLQVVRSYNSQAAATDGDFGYGWTWNYGTRLVEDGGTGAVTWHDGDGSAHVFAAAAGGGYAPPAGVHARLAKNGDDTFTLSHLDGSRWHFGTDGLPAVWTDRNGNNLTFLWADAIPITGPELETVEDDAGLNLTFGYRSGRITKVEDPLGRTVEYAYDGSGNLDVVTDPLGATDRFDYDGSHRITRSIDRANVLFEFEHDGSDRLTDLDVSLYDPINDGPAAGTTIDRLNVTYASLAQYAYANVTNDRGHEGSVRTDLSGLPDRIDAPVAGGCGALALCQRLAANGGAAAGGGCGCCGGSGDLKGDVYTLTWDSDNNLLQVEDALTNRWEYGYDAYGNALNATDPLGNVTEWGWDVTDTNATYIALLANWTNARGYAWTYEYDGDGNWINVTDPLGNYSTAGYDAHGYMTSRTDFHGNTWTYAYDTHGHLLNVTDPLENVTAYGHDDAGRVLNVTNARGYPTAYGWDAVNRLRNVTDALGNVTSFTYNGRGDRLTVTDALSRTTTYAWNLTVGKVASVTDASGNTTAYAYDGEGNLLSLTNARGYATAYAYDSANRLLNVTDALGNLTAFEYDDAGRVTKRTDRRGAETTFGYDALGRRVNVTDALGNVTAFAYDEVGDRISVTNARGYETTYAYDALNRLLNVTDALGNATAYAYDESGNLVELEDPNGHAHAWAYDALNRRISATDPMDHTTSYAYDAVGNLVSAEDANGNVTEYGYDALDRRILIRDALNDTTAFAYDAVGNTVNITDANDHTTTQEWDALNRLVRLVRPLGNTTTYAYDEVGNPVERVDPKGQRTNYTFDALDRLVRLDYPDGTNVTAEYDAEGNTVYAEGFGFSRTDTYDLLGRVTEIEFDFGPFNKTVAYTYDEIGNRLTMVDGEDETTTYEWDALDRLASMTAPGNLTFAFEYDPSSRRTKLTYPNGMYTNTTYDDADWVTLVESRWSNHTLIESFSYAYDDVGNRINVTYENGTSVRYAYDAAYRLTEENYSWGLIIGYTYDGTGNRLRETRDGVQTNYSYDAEDHLTARGNVTYEWDDNGNLVKKVAWDGNTTYAWDYENRLTNVTLANGTVLAYEYSVRNLRVSEWTDDSVTYALHDFYDFSHFDDVIAEYNETGVRRASFAHGPGVDEPLAVGQENVGYLFHDALGSVTGRVSASAGVESLYRYAAFGARLDGAQTQTRHGYSSREVDSVAGHYFFRTRWYDAQEGRYLSSEPWRRIASTNLYVGLANPTSAADSAGLSGVLVRECWPPCINGGGGGSGGSGNEGDSDVRRCIDCKKDCSDVGGYCADCGGQTQDPRCLPGQCWNPDQGMYSQCCENRCSSIPNCDCYG